MASTLWVLLRRRLCLRPRHRRRLGLEAAQEFRRVCAKANLVSCAPACDEQTYGFLLSIEIDGRGTVMTCNKVDGVFS